MKNAEKYFHDKNKKNTNVRQLWHNKTRKKKLRSLLNCMFNKQKNLSSDDEDDDTTQERKESNVR